MILFVHWVTLWCKVWWLAESRWRVGAVWCDLTHRFSHGRHFPMDVLRWCIAVCLFLFFAVPWFAFATDIVVNWFNRCYFVSSCSIDSCISRPSIFHCFFLQWRSSPLFHFLLKCALLASSPRLVSEFSSPGNWYGYGLARKKQCFWAV